MLGKGGKSADARLGRFVTYNKIPSHFKTRWDFFSFLSDEDSSCGILKFFFLVLSLILEFSYLKSNKTTANITRISVTPNLYD
jgi:hypothetical protein